MRCISITIAALGLSGCVGAAIKHKERVKIEAPRIDSEGTVRSGDAAEPISRFDVERIWGPPTRIKRVSDSEERWTYHSSDLRWAGVEVLILLLPIPLILPVGHESVTLTLREGRATSAEVVKEDERHVMAGLLPQMCGCRWGCSTSAGKFGPPGERHVNPTWLDRAKQN